MSATPVVVAAIDAGDALTRIGYRNSGPAPRPELSRQADAKELRLVAEAAIDLARALEEER